MENKKIVFIHGANSTPLSFNYISSQLTEYDHIFIQYEMGFDLEIIMDEILQGPLKDGTDFILMGHSLGGIIATLLSQKITERVKKLVTLSTPFLGSKSADYLKWVIPHYLLFRQISTKNKLLLELKEKGAVVPTLNITTAGVISPLFGAKPNDGVITLRSQLGLPGSKNVEFKLNHFEVLLSNDVAKVIKDFLPT